MPATTLFKVFFGNRGRSYLSARFGSVTLSMFYSIIYSKELGITNRSILAMIMSASLVLTLLTLGGVSLHSRHSNLTQELKYDKSIYFSIIIPLSLFNALVVFSILNLYSRITGVQIPNNLLLISLIYSFFASCYFGLSDGLLLLDSIREVALLDFTVVISQLIMFFFFAKIGGLSTIVCVLFAFIFSYVIAGFAIVVLLVYTEQARFLGLKTSMAHFFRDSKSAYVISVSNELNGRIDRLFVGLILPISELAKYAVATGLLSYFRFLPEALTKMSLALNANYFHRWGKFRRYFFLFAIIAILSISFLVKEFIAFFFGAEWAFTISVVLALTILELSRGFLSIVFSTMMLTKDLRIVRRYSFISLFFISMIFPTVLWFANLLTAILFMSIVHMSLASFGLKRDSK